MPAPTWAKGCTLGARQALSHLCGVSNPARVCSPYQPLPSHCPLPCDLWQGVTPAPLVTKCSQTVLLILKFWNHFLVSLYGPRFIISSLIRYLLSTYYVPIHLWHMVMNQIDLVFATEMMILQWCSSPVPFAPVGPSQWPPLRDEHHLCPFCRCDHQTLDGSWGLASCPFHLVDDLL